MEVDEREGAGFFNDPEKLNDPFPDLKYSRENPPVLYYGPITRHEGGSVSFGHGAHDCLGVLLAMEQTQIALETLFRRLPGLRLDESGEIRWYRNAANRGPSSLPIVF